MKTKVAIVLVSLFFTSCLPSFLADDEPSTDVGIKFEIINLTKSEHKNIKVTIGGLKNDTFVSTETYFLPKIRIKSKNSRAQYIATGLNRWKPNLNKIKEISDKAYFTVQLSGKTPVLLKNSSDSTKIVNAKITKNGVLRNEYGGVLSISIRENSITASYHEADNDVK